MLVKPSKSTQIQSCKQAFEENIQSILVEGPDFRVSAPVPLLSTAPGEGMWGGVCGTGG